MLVVVGIIAILIGAGMTTFSAATRKAQQARAREVVSNVATALEAVYQKEGSFPRRVLAEGSSDGEMTAEVAYELARRKAMTLTYLDSSRRTTGLDRCGVLTPWGQDTVKRAGNGSVSDSTKVPSGGTIKDHVVRYAIDLNGDGVIPGVSIGGESVDIRATAVAWCCGKDGKMESYSAGLKKDDVYSWTIGQTRGVQK